MNIAKQIFEKMENEGCRQITFHFDPKTKMKAILAVDGLPTGKNTSASGGTRFAHSDPDEALDDAFRLSKAMTKKTRILDVNEGGAKSVVIADRPKTKELLESVGKFIESQNGLLKTAVDMGFDLQDAEIISKKTRFIDSLSQEQNSLGSTGENTSEGMIHGFEVISKRLLNKNLRDCSISIQGLGSVGGSLARKLVEMGCEVIATDTDKNLCDEFSKLGVKIIEPEKIFEQETDIFSPCAMGGILNKQTIPKLRCKVVAAGANNPLSNEKEGENDLLSRHILLVPEFILNTAGFLQALVERDGGTKKEAREKSKIVGKRVNELIDFSQENKQSLLKSATELFGR